MLFLLSLCNQVEHVYMCELHKGAAFLKGSIGMKDCLDKRADTMKHFYYLLMDQDGCERNAKDL